MPVTESLFQHRAATDLDAASGQARTEATGGQPAWVRPPPGITRQAMDGWARMCQDWLPNALSDPTGKPLDRLIRRHAYALYMNHVMEPDGSIRALPAPHEGLPAPTERNDPDIDWQPQSQDGALIAMPKDKVREKTFFDARAENKLSGLSQRVTLSCDTINEATDERFVQACDRLSAVIAGWVRNDNEVVLGKTLAHMHVPRGDHGVVYLATPPSLEERHELGAAGSGLHAPSRHTPLGMLPIGPGTSYGETHLDKRGAHGVLALAPGARAPDNSLSSFGHSRAVCIAEAVNRWHADPDIPLETHLTHVLTERGYDPNEPALRAAASAQAPAADAHAAR